MGRRMILSKIRDPRLFTVRRGGSLQGNDQRLLAIWAADSAQHVKWQHDQLPDEIRELVLDDQRLRNELCWFVFEWCRGKPLATITLRP
jgi:hypothetical protein